MGWTTTGGDEPGFAGSGRIRGEFRADLYYRLNVVSIQLPPLRERPEDIEALVNEILLVTNRRFRRKLFGVTRDALRILQAYPWPSNVRELRNIIERAFIVETSDRIYACGAALRKHARRWTTRHTRRGAGSSRNRNYRRWKSSWSVKNENTIQLVLDRTNGNVSQAARILKLARTAFHRKLRHLGLRGSTAAG